MHHDLFGQSNYPKRTQEVTPDTQSSRTPIDPQTVMKFFGKDFLSMCGQGEIKKTPKMSEARLEKQKTKSAEQLPEDMKKEIIELF
jgi:hypothetical protein